MARATTSGGRGRRPAGRAAQDTGADGLEPIGAGTGGETPPVEPAGEPVSVAPVAEGDAAGPAPEEVSADAPVVAEAEEPLTDPAVSPVSEPMAEPEVLLDPAADAVPSAEPHAAPEPHGPAAGPASITEPAPAMTPEPVPPARRSGFGGMVAGGAVAAALGAGVVLALLPQGWRGGTAPDLTALETRLQALEGRAAPAFDAGPLEARLAALESSAVPDVAALESRLDALESQPAGAADLSGIESRLTALESAAGAPADLTAVQDRLTALESRTPPDLTPLSDRIAGLEAALPDMVARATADLAARVEDRAAEVEASAEDVAAQQARAEGLAALGTLGQALEQGSPAPEAVTALNAALPQPLAGLDGLTQGVPTRAALLADWPAAARAALARAPAAEAETENAVMGFLRRQTGARSLSPRDGASTDAILSRAEAALRAGDLQTTLTEIGALAPAPAAALDEWRTRASLRLQAEAALATARTALQAD